MVEIHHEKPLFWRNVFCFSNHRTSKLKKLNMEPEKSWLEDYFYLLGRAAVQGRPVKLQECKHLQAKKGVNGFFYTMASRKKTVVSS